MHARIDIDITHFSEKNEEFGKNKGLWDLFEGYGMTNFNIFLAFSFS